MQMYVMPKYGREYGFPKIYSEDIPLFEWLEKEGYPKELITKDMLILKWDVWPDNPAECHAL